MTDSPNERALDVITGSPELIEELERTIRETGQALLAAGASDMATFAPRLSAQLLYATAIGNDEMRRSVERQVRMLGTAQRIRAEDAAWASFYRVITAATSLLLRSAEVLTLALPGAAPVVAAASAVSSFRGSGNPRATDSLT